MYMHTKVCVIYERHLHPVEMCIKPPTKQIAIHISICTYLFLRLRHTYSKLTIAQSKVPVRRSPENTHKLMGFYMEVLILHVGAILQYMVSELFPIGCIGLIFCTHH